jgi:hypothetical protein
MKPATKEIKVGHERRATYAFTDSDERQTNTGKLGRMRKITHKAETQKAGSAAAVAAFASCVAKGGRHKQGLVPDIGVHFG